MKLKLDIKSNAIDSFNESLAKYEQGEAGDLRAFKFAISHLSHCIELVLKMYLQTLDENLVFAKCHKEVVKRAKSENINLLEAYNLLEGEDFDFKKVIKDHNNPYTVTVDQALSVAKCETCGITGSKFVDQDFIDDIQWMKDLRNSIEHYQFEFTAKEVRLCVGRLVRDLAVFTDVFSLFDLEEAVGKDRYHVFAVLIDEYEHDLQEAKLEVAETKAAIFNSTRPKHRMFIEWNEYTCEKCGNDTMIPNADSSTGYRCTLKDCENEESEEIEVDCDICGCPWPNGEMTSWVDTYSYVCPRCDNPEGW
ncbi:hypothetical protein N474_23960 [Pseudoalteromonas luteoviolacea CPMOR-2]|uniref:hypothetical protein n=1 Tax=Pseudoalteromonas luteoviolacea TaxID=43657 RepID=UPI0007B05962|nr:hypothetical protein [Pseudoalteromonas luteoviolacea]KZN51500.1 hypothetical protein N474_23960 [Pseudoalteromonas luteoviolacea CPMOR-2]